MSDPPLMGFEWNQGNGFPDLGLLTIVAFDGEKVPHPIGTAFIINRRDRSADCITAAHVFAEIRRLQSPPPLHNPSTPPEFLPPKRAMKIGMNSVWALSVEGSRIEPCEIKWMVMDDHSDIAFFSIALQPNSTQPFFSHVFTPNGETPSVGDLICIFGYAGMKVANQAHQDNDNWGFELGRRLLLRVGRVLGFYPDGNRLCRGPCYETSIPVYSGMSGSPAFIYAEDGPVRPFGLVCSDPDLDDERKENRSIAGRSIVAAFKFADVTNLPANKVSALQIIARDVAGEFDSPSE